MGEQPWSREAELELLSAAMLDPSSIDVVAEMIRPSDLFHGLHRKAYDAQLAVWRRSGALDYPLLMAELDRAGVVEDQRHAVMAAMQVHTGLTAHVREYAEVVRDCATLRRVIAAAADITVGAQGRPEDVSAFVCEAEGKLRSVAERGSAGIMETADRGVENALRFHERARAGDTDALGLPTGFLRIDHEIGRMPSGMVIVMGRPNNGKSSFALQVARSVAALGHGVAVFSLEMNSEKVHTVHMAGLARVCVRDLLSGVALPADEQRRLADAAQRVRELPMLLDCQTGLSARQVTVRAQRARRELAQRGHTLRLVVVDTFNRLDHGTRGNENESTAMARSSSILTDYAKEARVTLINVCQLNRGCEDRLDKRPIMRDIRQCGRIEEDAEVMLGCYIARKHEPTAREGDAEMVICKSRMGATTSIPFHFDGPPNRWMEREA